MAHRRKRKFSKKTVPAKKKGIVIVSPIEMINPLPLPEAMKRVKRLESFHKKRIEALELTREYQLETGGIPIRKQGDAKVMNWSPQYATAGERFEVIRTLKKKGYDVRVLSPKKKELKQKFERFIKKARKLGIKEVETKERDEQLVSYIRDMEIKIGGKIFISPLAKDDVFKKVGENSPRIRSELGEGGRVVEGKNFLLVSADIERLSGAELSYFKKEGISVFRVPEIIDIKKLRRWPKEKALVEIPMLSGHIDTYINVIPKQKLLVIDPNYYKMNKSELNKLAKTLKHKIVTVPKAEADQRPTNFLRLPDGKILISKAPKLIEKLKKEGVKDSELVVMPRRVYFNPEYGHGGIRCFATSVNVEAHPNKPVSKTKSFRKMPKPK